MPAGYKKGLNNHAVKIPKFTIADVSGVTFGGFEADKYINSQPSAMNEAGTAWYDVAHGGNAGTIPGISRPGVPVWDYITFPQAMIACCNKGKGWHLTSAFEWAAMAFLAKKYGTQPHGGNANVDPPSDITYTTEIAMLDKHLHGENGSYYRPLPGTGPATWAHNHLASGIYDLQGCVWQWVQGLFLENYTGYAWIPGSLDVTYTGSPYGRGTISGSGGASPTLTCDGDGANWKKAWTPDAFDDMLVYIAEAGGHITVLNETPTAGGASYVAGDILTIAGGGGATCRVRTVNAGTGAVTAVDLLMGGGGYTTGAGKATTGGSGDGNCTVNITTVNAAQGGAFFPIADTTATTLVLGASAAPGNGTATFCIVKQIATDITSGMASANKILTLRNSDADLKGLALPATSDATGSAIYGKDGYWFNKAGGCTRGAYRGGSFDFGAYAGVFALHLNFAPSYSGYHIGFRACKSL